MTRLCPLLVTCLLIACTPTPPQSGKYKIALVPSRVGQHGIFVMNADTSGGKLLTSDVSAQLRLFSWSPDGRRIAFFTSRREDSGMLEKYRMPQHYPLYVMDATGANQKRLLDFPVSSFGWSPGGGKMFFISAYEDPAHSDPDVVRGSKPALSAIYVLHLATGEQRRLTAFGQNCSASWSPDGTRLALSLGDDHSSDIYVTNLDSSHARRLTDAQTIDTKPVWSPNGRMIAYTSVAPPGVETKNAGVYVIDVDSGQKKRVADLATYGMSWSPDAKMLLLQAIGAIYMVGPGGGDLVKLRAPTDSLLDAVFTPDGQKVMFRSNYEGDWNLYAVDLNDKKCRRITEQLSAFMFCLSPLLEKH